MPVLVMRCDEGPPYVPSRVVTCSGCGAGCWLSEYSGASTLALAAAMGSPEILCEPCLTVLVDATTPGDSSKPRNNQEDK
jgi:hypothetical protein